MQPKALALALLTLLVAGLVAADPGPGALQDPAEVPKEMEEAEETAVALTQPGPSHSRLDPLAGDWDLRYRLTLPGAPESVGAGSAVHCWKLGGRFLELEAKADFLGRPTEFLRILGFDRRAAHYTSTAMDSRATYAVSATGYYDKESKALELKGSEVDPQTGDRTDLREVYTILDRDQFRYELWMTLPGQPTAKVLTIDYARRG